MGNCFSGGGQGGRLVGGAAAAAGGAGLKSGADGAVNLFLKSGCLRSPYTQIEVGISIRIPHRKTLDSSSVVPFVLVPEFRDLGRCGFHWALSLSATDLCDEDVLSKSDSLAIVYAKKKDGKLEELGRTEVILNSANPVWTQKIIINYEFEVLQHLV
ncbi:hypothetical protein GW17_00049157 [Ensete ventricosum]|nr:hypothetical protein GW17_00049157 [Ensete ventricosum]